MKQWLLAGLLLGSLAACSEKAIEDKVTKESITEVSAGNGTIVNPLSDAMDRGQHELEKNVAVDTAYYKTRIVARGDIVYYGDKSVSRVVALPNEKIKIKNGQIYINGAKLAAFYGAAHVRGYDDKEFQASDMEEPAKQNLIAEIFKKEVSEITLGGDEVFVIGDDWSRSGAPTSRSLSLQDIKGRVIGVCTACGNP
ncbi:S26 family signal peptidase [Paenibacillus sp. UNC499MF]|uniref:S26 family signal peptidase n=1 Tax=Paenibacillus sp. UNC499MF TaxID=1502751 RepID=UPI00089FFD11|nr:S26 family signal peptidase [Paenibacillus sp. UNC499MF]SEG25179.1 signal peptidase I [Paenibacillus sp. UNC499MF]